METIDIRAKEILGIGDSFDAYHLYIVYTNNNGEEFIIRGGPDDANALTGNIHVVGVDENTEYSEANNNIHRDWDYNGNDYSVTAMRGEDLSQEFKNMQTIGKEINDEQYDYEVVSENSNTVVKTVYEGGTGKDLPLPKDSQGNIINVPGAENTLSHGPIDKAVDWLGEKFNDLKNWLFGTSSDDGTADKSKVLNQQVDGNTGSGVGDGHTAVDINIDFSSILSMTGDFLGGIADMIGGVISSVVDAIGNVISGIGDFFGGIIDSIGGFFGFGGAAPVLLDLDNDGIELSDIHHSSTFFDIDGDGYMEKTAWAAADDALLVVDLFQDGRIDFAEEVNFTLWDSSAKSDMQALRNVFDSNHNGMLDAGDARFAEFKVWQDVNQNGHVDEGELKTLAETGITSINLDSKIPESGTDGKVVNGNVVYDDTTITWTNGKTGRAYDVALAYSVGGIRFEGNGNEFSINYEDGREVKVFQAPEGAALDMDAAVNDVMTWKTKNDMTSAYLN